MPIRAIIFDLMDVLLRVEDVSAWRQWEAQAGVAEGGLARAMFQSPRFKEAIMGQVPEAELWCDVARALGLEANEPATLAAVFYSAFRLNTGLVELMRFSGYKSKLFTDALYFQTSLRVRISNA